MAAPTLVIVGGGDQPTVLAAADAIAAGVAGARLAVMPGLGHVPNMEQPAEFNQLVFDFLAQVGA